MLLDIDTHSGVPIYRQVIDQITQQIMAGQVEAGEQLPSVRDLAARLKVNPMTISKAYSFLEAGNLVERQRGVGLFVAKIGPGEAEQTKAEILQDLLRKAAVTAVQLEIDPDEAVRLFRELYEHYDSRRRSKL
ncbi:MAG: GntR family transcriptional regulator [Sedimentisphaerales bacterium]|nr:GntR family transcriptional regulator [Sedimentisphaerales bacterium]